MSFKKVFSITLLLFVAVSLVYLLTKSAGENSTATGTTDNQVISELDDGVVVYYFHRNKRCPTCLKIEDLSKQAMKKFFAEDLAQGKMEWHVINVESNGNEHYETDYDLVSQALVVTLRKDGEQVDWKNLEKVWGYVWEQDRFLEYVHTEILSYQEQS
jgi:thiol-disulfide isomerase/thioredoxin